VFLILPIICSDCLQQPVAQKHWVYKATTNTLHFIVKQLRALGMVRGHVLHLYTKYESMNQYFWSFREIVGYYAPIWGTLSNAAIRPPLCLSVCLSCWGNVASWADDEDHLNWVSHQLLYSYTQWTDPATWWLAEPCSRGDVTLLGTSPAKSCWLTLLEWRTQATTQQSHAPISKRCILGLWLL